MVKPALTCVQGQSNFNLLCEGNAFSHTERALCQPVKFSHWQWKLKEAVLERRPQTSLTCSSSAQNHLDVCIAADG